MIVADGPDLWETRDGERIRWLGRLDPKLAERAARLLNEETRRKT